VGEPRAGLDDADGVERLTATDTPAVPPPIARQRNAILVVLFVLAVAGWIVLIRQSSIGSGGMDHDGMASGPDLTMGRSAPLFFAMWVAMMVGMMFPAAAPMMLMYGRMQRRPAALAVFGGSYIVLWFAFGALAFGLGVLVEIQASRSEWVMMNWARAGGALIAAAGVYQLTPLKDLCLRQCRTPLSFVMTHWRDGTTGAARMGMVHGLYCVGCCWLLFLILVPLGLMNIAAMIAVTLVVFAEKVLPWGRGFGRVAAVGLLVYGGLVIARPELLPTVA
jgi:predicted metal-binding membrane protein